MVWLRGAWRWLRCSCRKRGAGSPCWEWEAWLVGSPACCAASLCLVVFELAHYADIEDISAFLDTANAFRLAAGGLLAVTLGLNAILALRLWARDA